MPKYRSHGLTTQPTTQSINVHCTENEVFHLGLLQFAPK